MMPIREIEKLEVFREFNTEQKKKLSLISKKKNYRKLDKIYLSKYRANRVFVVLKGKVDLHIVDPDRVIGVSFGSLTEGQLFGGASVLKPQEYTVTALCEEDSELLVFESRDLIELMIQDYEIGYKFMKKVAQVYFDRYERTKKELHEMIKTASLVAHGF